MDSSNVKGKGTAVEPEGRRWWKDSDRGTKSLPAEPVSVVVLRPCFLRRRKYPARRRELFSLRKKRTAGIGLPAWQEAGSLYRLNSHPFSSLEKPLKITGIQGESLPHPTPADRKPSGMPPRGLSAYDPRPSFKRSEGIPGVHIPARQSLPPPGR